MSIPPLPEKSVLNNSNSKFLEARRLEIEMSLNIIGKHPVLKTCLPFKLFLQCPDEFFDREQQNLSDTSNTFQYNDIEDAIDQFISIVEAQLNHILIRKIQPFSKELSSIDRAINLLHSPTYLFYTSFASLVKSQNDLQEIFDSLHFPESDTFQKTTKEANLSLKIPNNESNALVLKIKEETLKIEGLKNAISDYKKTMQKYSEFELLINRKLGKQRHVTDPQKSEKYLKEIESVQCEIAKIEKELENVESNIKRESI